MGSKNLKAVAVVGPIHMTVADPQKAKDIILCVGGTVAAPLELERNRPDVERRFRETGLNRVLRNTCTASEAVPALKADLGID